VLNMGWHQHSRAPWGTWQFRPDSRPCFRVLVSEQGVHRVAVPEKYGWHSLRHCSSPLPMILQGGRVSAVHG
jgi:hypothetical protein